VEGNDLKQPFIVGGEEMDGSKDEIVEDPFVRKSTNEFHPSLDTSEM
jgi:hypothetical protein